MGRTSCAAQSCCYPQACSPWPRASASAQNTTPHNLILFVPDGLRALKVTPETGARDGRGPRQGRQLQEFAFAVPDLHHRERVGDGDRSLSRRHRRLLQHDLHGFTSAPAGDTVVPFLENDAVLGDVDEHFKGDYLDEETILKMARAQGLLDRGDRQGRPDPDLRSHRPRQEHHHRDRRFHRRQDRRSPLRRDEGRPDQGRPAAGHARTRRQRQGRRRQDARHDRRQRRPAGLFRRRRHQGRAADVQGAQQAVRAGVLVARSRRQPAQQGDSLNTVTPGINGPTSMAGIKNADDNLAQLRKALDDLGLAATTDIIVSADHGFSTISKESKTSPSAKVSYDDTPKDFLPMGFLALDLAKALDLPLFDPNDKNARHRRRQASQGRQRRARQGSRQARPRRRHQWRLGPDLSAEQGQEARRAHHQGAARAGLCQRPVRRRRARQVPRHAADVGDQPGRARR